MSELGISAKLIRLSRMTLSNSCTSVKVGMDLSETFDTVRGFRQGEPLSCDLFNFVMESVLRKAGVHRNGTIFQKSVQLLAYADVIAIIGRTKRNLINTKMGLAVNEVKTKYMFSTSKDVRRIDSQITILLIQSKNLFILAPPLPSNMITLANRCYYGINGQLSNRDLSRTTKLIFYKTLILPVLFYGAEAWTPLSTDAAALRVF